jgi:release factor glutamine methyltransferase
MMSETAEIWTVRRLLEWTTPFFERKAVDPARLSAEQLLAHVLSVPRIKLYTDYERVIEAGALSRFRELVRRAAEQEPIAYLTGRAHFFDLELMVTRDVLIPRPDTETIVEQALRWLRDTPSPASGAGVAGAAAGPRALDLCTGCGAIAAAVAKHHKNCQVVATDISVAAIAVAGQNIERLGLGDRVELAVGDLFEPLEKLVDRRPFDMLVCNPPYIATGQIAKLERSVRDYEPALALDGGMDGLMFHRRILEAAGAFLVNGARVYLEIAFDQAEAVMEVAGGHSKLREPTILRDAGGRPRVLAGIWRHKAL